MYKLYEMAGPWTTNGTSGGTGSGGGSTGGGKTDKGVGDGDSESSS